MVICISLNNDEELGVVWYVKLSSWIERNWKRGADISADSFWELCKHYAWPINQCKDEHLTL